MSKASVFSLFIRVFTVVYLAFLAFTTVPWSARYVLTPIMVALVIADFFIKEKK